MPKRTWQPKKIKRIKKHGFLTKSKTTRGRNTLKRRRIKKRRKLAVTISS